MIDTLKQDLTYALRSLLATPAFFVVAVATLALGVGSVSAVYSVVDGTLLKPLPYPDAERIVRIHRMQGGWTGPISGPLLSDWREGSADGFAALAAFTDETVNLSGSDGAERLAASRVTPAFWDVMALPPRLGRYFGESEERSNERVVVLGHELWQRRFAADGTIVGRDLMLNGERHRVLGVAPDAFRYPSASQIYLPTYLPASQRPRGGNFLSVVGRLKPDVSLAQAHADMEALNARLAEAFPDEHAGLGARLTPLPALLVDTVRRPLLILLGASALVLLIACANLANLLLARGNRRQRELAVRTALGASRGRLLQSVMVEATIIAVSGGLLGVALAALAVPLLLATAPEFLPEHSSPGVGIGVIAVSLALTVATVLGFALWPALRAASVAPAGALQEAGRSDAGGHARGRIRSVLVVAEVALSLTLLVGAGLLIESLRRLGQVETGVRTEGVLTAALLLDGIEPVAGESVPDQYRRQTQTIAPKLDAIIARVRALPGVDSVGLSDALPLSGVNNISGDVDIVGRETALGETPPHGAWRFVNPGFFQAMGMNVLRGRGLEDSDQRPGAISVNVLVNDVFARRFLSDVDPVGQQLSFFGFGTAPMTIVGVVNDTRLHGVDREVYPEIYMPHSNATQNQFYLALKVSGDPLAYAEVLRTTLRELDPDMPLFEVRSMDQLVAGTTRMRHFNLRLMSVFSAVALLLAAIGLYGVIAYSVAERRHEFGIRLSLGANGGRLLGLVLRQGMALVTIGIVVGLAGAFALGRALSSQLYGVGAADPGVIAIVVLILGAVALAACLIPAFRAARVDPMVALRRQ